MFGTAEMQGRRGELFWDNNSQRQGIKCPGACGTQVGPVSVGPRHLQADWGVRASGSGVLAGNRDTDSLRNAGTLKCPRAPTVRSDEFGGSEDL